MTAAARGSIISPIRQKKGYFGVKLKLGSSMPKESTSKFGLGRFDS